MDGRTPVVLIASVSRYERHRLELALKPTGWTLCGVDSVQEAERACSVHGAPLLLIDSGLLEMPHDGRWRELRRRRPGLGAVVRCLVPLREIRRVDRNTFLVHPDDDEGICRALGALHASPLAPA